MFTFFRTVDSLVAKFTKLEAQLLDLGQSKLDEAMQSEAVADELLERANASRSEADRAFRIAHRVGGLTR